jgi:hypothetical protein
MSQTVTLDLDTTGLKRLIARAKTAAPQAMADGLNMFAGEQLRIAARRLPARQQQLRRSIQATKATADDLRTTVGSSLPWARITHYGGTIRPTSTPTSDQVRRRVFGMKTPQYLSIPLPGTPKSARARDYQDKGLFPWKNPRTGKRFLALPAEAKGGKLKLLFLLLPSVTIKPHPYLYFDAADQARLSRRLKWALTQVLKPTTPEVTS